MWTRFQDMHSGGGRKCDFDIAYIEAPESVVKAVFEHRFGRDPNNVTCDCCGDDYSVWEFATLEEAMKDDRGEHVIIRASELAQ